jgi:hypothetical protein
VAKVFFYVSFYSRFIAKSALNNSWEIKPNRNFGKNGHSLGINLHYRATFSPKAQKIISYWGLYHWQRSSANKINALLIH